MLCHLKTAMLTMHIEERSTKTTQSSRRKYLPTQQRGTLKTKNVRMRTALLGQRKTATRTSNTSGIMNLNGNSRSMELIESGMMQSSQSKMESVRFAFSPKSPLISSTEGFGDWQSTMDTKAVRLVDYFAGDAISFCSHLKKLKIGPSELCSI